MNQLIHGDSMIGDQSKVHEYGGDSQQADDSEKIIHE